VKRQVNTKSEHFDRPGSESYLKSIFSSATFFKAQVITHPYSYHDDNIESEILKIYIGTFFKQSRATYGTLKTTTNHAAF
jgi:hypothetical protein